MIQNYSRAIGSIDSPQDQCSKTITEPIESIVLYRTRIQFYSRDIESILSTGPVFQNHRRAIGSIDSLQDQCSKTITELIESIVSLQNQWSKTITEL